MYVFYLSVSLGLLLKQSISSFVSDQNNKKSDSKKNKINFEDIFAPSIQIEEKLS